MISIPLRATCKMQSKDRLMLRNTLHADAKRWKNIYVCNVSDGEDSFVSGSSEEKTERKSWETLRLHLCLSVYKVMK
jgi:hypothetical protein